MIGADGSVEHISTNVGSRTETLANPNGKLSEINTYDERGDLLEELKAYEGKTLTTKHTYDSEGHVLSTTDPEGHVNTNTWDGSDLAAQTDARGHTIKYEYNSAGELTGVIGPDGAKEIAVTRDGEGKPTRIEHAGAGTYTYEYDGHGHPTQITSPAGVTEKIGYDANGYPATITGGAGQVTHLTYSPSGQLSEEVSPTGAKTSFGYDADGNLTSVTDPRGDTTEFTYDAFGRRLTGKYPMDHSESFTYDEAGRLIKRVDAEGHATNYAYDTDGNVAEEANSEGERTLIEYNALEQPISIANNTQTLGYAYDGEGHVTEVTASAVGAAPATTLKYTYDGAGNRTSLTGPDGTTHYSYDSHSRLESVTPAAEPGGHTFGFTYTPAGQLTQLTRPNGVTDTLTYDGGKLASRTSKLGAETLAGSSYTYNESGLRGSLATAGGGRTGYTYNPVGELTQETPEGAAATSYEYDAAGNRTASSGPSGSSAYTNNEADEPTSNGSETFSYDPDGELTERKVSATAAATTYGWNAHGELTAIHMPDGKTEAFAYDPLGRRVSATSGEQTTSYVYDGQNVHLEYTATGGGTSTSPSAIYTDGLKPNEVLEMARGGKRYSYLVDGQGSTLALADESGAVVQRYSYDAFGVPTISGSLTNPFLYTGQIWDPESGLYYDRARYYEPAAGRFISKDPLFAVNPYAYVQGDPTNATDPTGKQFLAEQEVVLTDENTLDRMEAYVTDQIAKDVLKQELQVVQSKLEDQLVTFTLEQLPESESTDQAYKAETTALEVKDAIEAIGNLKELITTSSPFAATHIYHDVEAALNLLSLYQAGDALSEEASFVNNEL